MMHRMHFRQENAGRIASTALSETPSPNLFPQGGEGRRDELILPAFFGLFLLLLLACAGCSKDEPAQDTTAEKPKSEPATESPLEQSKEDARSDGSDELATLKGRVTFQGKLPEAVKISVTKDVEYCSQHVGERSEVEVSESGGLAGAIVEIRGVDPPASGWEWQSPEEGYVVRQKGCAFQPALLVIPAGSEVKVFNDDPVGHNINTGQWNFMQAADAEPIVQKVSGQRPVRMGCNIHSWMEGWIYPARSPFYAVTDAEGKFEIMQIPPGKYRVTAWHPNLRVQRESLELSGVVEQEFMFDSPY